MEEYGILCQNPNQHQFTEFRRTAMAKARDTKKDDKKKPAKTLKEKRKAKQEKRKKKEQ